MSRPPTTDSPSPSFSPTSHVTASVDTTSREVLDTEFEAHVNDDTYIARDRDEFFALAQARSSAKAFKVLHVIETYGLPWNQGGASSIDVYGFSSVVTRHIMCGRPVRLLLSGYTFQDSNRRDELLSLVPNSKVKLELERLQGLCDKIKTVYDVGAEVHICLDGLVYNDLLGVSDGMVWEYGETLQKLANTNSFHNLKFIQLWDLLDQHSSKWTKEYYLEHAASIRWELVRQYRDAQLEMNVEQRSDEDMVTRHRSHIGYAADDVASSLLLTSPELGEKRLESPGIARAMVERRKMFVFALEAKGGDYVDISIPEGAGGIASL